jgi:hypothetical protein
VRSGFFRNIVTQIYHKLEVPKSGTWYGQEHEQKKNYQPNQVFERKKASPMNFGVQALFKGYQGIITWKV